MAKELKQGEGIVFKNDKKTNEKQPDYRGQICTPLGDIFDVSMWVRTGKESGKKFFSVSIQEPYKKPSTDPHTFEPLTYDSATQNVKVSGNSGGRPVDQTDLPF